jgi:hypothetical protein
MTAALFVGKAGWFVIGAGSALGAVLIFFFVAFVMASQNWETGSKP